MSRSNLKIICRDTKPTDDMVVFEEIILACEKFNGAQYLSQEELQEKVNYLEQRIADKKANPEKFKARAKDSPYTALVAEIEGKIVGFTVRHKLSEDGKVVPEAQTELDALYVLPEYQKQGVGFALWNAVIEKLRQQGETILQLATITQGPEDEHGNRGPGNENAIQFYKRQGCLFLDKTHQWQSPTGIPKSKISVQQYLAKKIDK